MKSGTLLALILLIFLSPLTGQFSSVKERARFTTIISFTDNPNFRQKGKLYDTYNASLSLINPYSYKVNYKSLIKSSNWDLNVTESELLHFQVNRIDKIYMRKDGNIIKGILIGALLGSVTGYFLGQYSGDDPAAPGFTYTADQKSGQYGLLLGTAGGLAGGIIGANIRVEIPIGASQQEYRRLKPKLDIYKLAIPAGASQL